MQIVQFLSQSINVTSYQRLQKVRRLIAYLLSEYRQALEDVDLETCDYCMVTLASLQAIEVALIREMRN